MAGRTTGTSGLVALAAALVAALALAHTGQIRARAEAALGAGMPVREAALARGFVLGEDEDVDRATIEDFRRAGLSHLLAVSGQNVALLALLAMPLLAALGMPLRARLTWLLAAIVVYVPLAGAGPSIVRAGVMGGLGVLATLAGRRSSRLYALILAAGVTLALDPRIGGDVGWQLSFAAVLGILALAGPLRESIARRIGGGYWRRALAEAVAMTTAATAATAPLIAFHFEGVSTTTLLANLLVLPAVAPAMWLGMLAAAGAQVPGFPVEVLNGFAAPLLAYVAQIAAWCGRPRWAYAHVRLGPGGLIAAYVGLAAALVAVPALLRRRRLARLRRDRRHVGSGRDSLEESRGRGALRLDRWPRIVALAVAIVLALGGRQLFSGGAADAAPSSGLRISVLDVGQGDAILLQPAHAAAVLVDGGPHRDDLARKLREAGADSVGVPIVSHEQADHAAGIEDLLGRYPLGKLLYARLSRRLRNEAELAGAEPQRIAAGTVLESGRLRLDVLWPPSQLLSEPLAGADPNSQALVLLARWRSFEMLLTADAEAGEVPIDPGPVDVLKVAHHGSEDPGLESLLDRARPRLAVISVGAGNPFGHPTAATLAALDRHRVPTLRTDRDGTVVIEVDGGGFSVRGVG